MSRLRSWLRADLLIVRLGGGEKRSGFLMLATMSRAAQRITVKWWDVVVEAFLRLKVRIKLSVIVGASIIAVTLVISTVAVDIQERELRTQITVLGSNLVLSLSSVAEDNLLLQSTPVLQDYIKNFGKREIPGLEHMYVMDRQGIIVAHINPDSVGRQVSREDWDILTEGSVERAVETETQFRFVQPIYVRAHDKVGTRGILLGSASVSFNKQTLLTPVVEMRAKILSLSALVSVVAIGLVYFMSKRIVHVIIVLSDAARRVGTGDLKVMVTTRVKDEIGMLAKDFNMMVLQLREKLEMQKYVSRSTVEMISRSQQASEAGERKQIVVMFTDLRSFTSYSERHRPEDVVETLNQYLDLQTCIIHDHNGVVDKFLGDGIMCEFASTRMVDDAMETAMDIQRRIADLNQARKKQNAAVLQVGIGIASGIAVVGSVGSKDRMDYTAIGDIVNVASRLCSIAGPAEILVTGEIAGSLKKKYAIRSEGRVAVKGRQQQLDVFRIPTVV